MVTKKVSKKINKKRSRSAAAGNAGGSADRQKRLQMLRAKNKENPSSTSGNNDRPLAALLGDEGGSGSIGSDKRELIKKIVKKRKQGGPGAGALGQKKGAKKKGVKKKGLLRQALKKKSQKGNDSPGQGGKKFARLKAGIKKRRSKESDEGSLSVDELKARVAKLEKALKKTLQQIESAKELEVQVSEKVSTNADEADND